MFVKDIAELFPSYAADDEEAQECLQGDFADLGAEETARQFLQAEAVLEDLMAAAEHLTFPLYVALSEAKSRVKEAHLVAERYAR